jgi:hypothetical protein
VYFDVVGGVMVTICDFFLVTATEYADLGNTKPQDIITLPNNNSFLH